MLLSCKSRACTRKSVLLARLAECPLAPKATELLRRREMARCAIRSAAKQLVIRSPRRRVANEPEEMPSALASLPIDHQFVLVRARTGKSTSRRERLG